MAVNKIIKVAALILHPVSSVLSLLAVEEVNAKSSLHIVQRITAGFVEK